MKLLVFSGLLYLAGVAILLYIKPSLMFRSDGSWKEFGIGRNTDDYTWMPFWLGAILWAIISYMSVLLISDSFISGRPHPVELDDGYPRKSKRGPLNSKRATNVVNVPDRDVMPGYYILNTERSKKGFPKYIYVGEAPPAEIELEGGDGGEGGDFE